MEWLRTHPYITALLGALLAIGIGTIVVLNRSDVKPEPSGLRAWGGVGSNLFDPTSVSTRREPSAPSDDLYTQVQSGPPFYYAPATRQLPLAQEEAENFDFDAFIALLSASSGGTSGSSEEAGALDAYSFIPQGLISTSVPRKRLTPTQRAIFDYGNEVGSHIQSFEEWYRSAPQILKDQFEDRENPEKNAALLSLARGLEDVGSQLEAIQAPSEIRLAHQKVAASYKELGTKLSAVPGAKSNEAVLNTILAYNTAVETYVKNFVALATLISAHGVSFSSDDPGSVFTFSNVSF